MTKRVALIGHCGPDSSFLRMAVSRAAKGAQVVAADETAELDRLLSEGVDLLLFNRVLDYGFDRHRRRRHHPKAPGESSESQDDAGQQLPRSPGRGRRGRGIARLRQARNRVRRV